MGKSLQHGLSAVKHRLLKSTPKMLTALPPVRKYPATLCNPQSTALETKHGPPRISAVAFFLIGVIPCVKIINIKI